MKILGFCILLFLANNTLAWTTSTTKDKMTGEVTVIAKSSYTSPLEEMAFPYNGIRSFIGFGCKKYEEYAYIYFNRKPHLAYSKTHNGYDLITERVKWDDQVFSTQFHQSWGSNILFFSDDKEIISKILTKSTMLLELHWYGEGAVYFQYSLEGSSNAIQDARNICRN